jgi:hypothetical protein
MGRAYPLTFGKDRRSSAKRDRGPEPGLVHRDHPRCRRLDGSSGCAGCDKQLGRDETREQPCSHARLHSAWPADNRLTIRPRPALAAAGRRSRSRARAGPHACDVHTCGVRSADPMLAHRDPVAAHTRRARSQSGPQPIRRRRFRGKWTGSSRWSTAVSPLGSDTTHGWPAAGGAGSSNPVVRSIITIRRGARGARSDRRHGTTWSARRVASTPLTSPVPCGQALCERDRLLDRLLDREAIEDRIARLGAGPGRRAHSTTSTERNRDDRRCPGREPPARRERK